MGKRIKDKDPDCKLPILAGHYRCGGCGLSFLKEVVKYAEVSGYDDGVDVGICVECQALFNPKENNDCESPNQEVRPESHSTDVQTTG